MAAGGSRKIGRNLNKCKIYKSEHRQERNRDARIARKIKGLPGGHEAYEAVKNAKGIIEIRRKES